MNRFLPLIAVAAFVLAACGSPASAAKASPSPSGANGLRNGASGQLVQVNGQTLILTGPNGDTTVMVTATTTYTKTSIATLADIVKGTCIVANGQKDPASGAITVTNVRISPKAAAGCTSAGPGGNPGAFSPPANATPRPTPSGQANLAFVTGEVTAVSGPSITVKTAAGASQTFSVASAATITDSADVTIAALQNGQCLRANGAKDSSGNVQATSVTITPAGPSGTCTTGGAGRGGFGGGNRPGGGTAGGG
jgi:hypothetical protein